MNPAQFIEPAVPKPAPAVFLDKDGTLVEDRPFNVDPEKLRVYPEVPAALAALANAGYRLIVVTNQPGIAHGYFDEAAVIRIGETLGRYFRPHGVELDGFYICPHHPDGAVAEYSVECNCHKPAEGLLRTAAREKHLDLRSSWMIGDILNDVEAGNRAGCRTVLVDRGNETEWMRGRFRQPRFTVPDLAQASQRILSLHHRRLKVTE